MLNRRGWLAAAVVLACTGSAFAEPWGSVPTMLTAPGSAATVTPAWVEVGAMASLGDRCVFWADSGRTDLPQEIANELWVSDGTAAGTHRLRRMGGRPTSVAAFTVGGRRMACYTAPYASQAIWTDGTEEGSVEGPRVGDVVGELSGAAVFRAGATVQIFDGQGLHALGDVGDGAWKSQAIGEYAGALYFVLWEGQTLAHLASTDGTPAGTRLVESWTPIQCGVRRTTAFINDRLLAVECNDSGQTRLRAWDPATEETVRITLPAGIGAVSGVTPAPDGRTAIVCAFGGTFLTDGTPEGTVPISTDLISTREMLGELDTPAGPRTLFMGADRTTGLEPWATDGTPVGTLRLGDLRRGNSTVTAAGVAEGRLWLSTDSGVWSTDGTPASTRNASPLIVRQTQASQAIGPFFALAGERMCFSTADRIDRLQVVDAAGNASELRPDRSVPLDGPGGIAMTAGGRGVMVWNEPGRGPGVYATDGTSLGTVRLRDLDGARAWSSASSAAGLAWFYTPTDGVSRVEIWRSDGTAAGTFLVGTVPAQWMTEFVETAGGVVCGQRLYWSNGQPGTLVQNGQAYLPRLAASPEGKVYYFSRPHSSYELWAVDVNTGTAAAVPGVAPVSGVNQFAMRFFGGRALLALNGVLWLLDEAGTPARQLATGVVGLESAGGAGVVDRYDEAMHGEVIGLVDPATGAVTDLGIVGSSAVMTRRGARAVIAITQPGMLTVWTTDGTSVGTVRAATAPGMQTVFRGPLVCDGDELILRASAGAADPYAAWAVNLRDGGVHRVGRAGEGTAPPPILPMAMTPIGGTLVSRQWTEASGWQLYSTRRCAADFSADGFLDGFDWSAFVDSFETGAADADFNGDGFVDFFDYDGFVGAFEAGC